MIPPPPRSTLFPYTTLFRSGDNLEANIYKTVRSLLSNYDNQLEIRKEFPKKTVERRNTGYAIDLLLETAPFTAGGPDFNFCTLIAGSEGTLAFITEIKLNVVPQIGRASCRERV